MPAVRAEDVRRRYGDAVALDGVTLSVEEGEVFGLIGPNGAGKTTLVRAITGTTDAEGAVAVFGEPPTDVDRSRLGLLPQEFDPPARLTPRELLAYYAGLYDEGRDVDDVLDDVGLSSAADTWYENLSGGQRRRACVGTALVNEPDLLVLDEPTTGIDPAGRRTLWSLLGDLADRGTTVLLTTHYMAEAEHLCDRVGLLADGRLVAEGSPAALVEAHGGDPRLEVEAADEAAAARALEAAGYRVVPDADRLAVGGIAPREVGDVAETLDGAGVDYGTLTWTQPDLEDVYLRATGRAVGSAGAPVERTRGEGGTPGGGRNGGAGHDGDPGDASDPVRGGDR